MRTSILPETNYRIFRASNGTLLPVLLGRKAAVRAKPAGKIELIAEAELFAHPGDREIRMPQQAFRPEKNFLVDIPADRHSQFGPE